MHRYAKKTLASWLRARRRFANAKGLQPIGERLGVSNDAPMYGVYEEYPICTTIANTQVGLRRTAHACPEEGQLALPAAAATACTDVHGWLCWQHSFGKIASKQHCVPSAADIVTWNKSHPKNNDGTRAMFLKIDWFFDVGVVDSNGNLASVYEVCYKNPMSQDKIDWLASHNIAWHELDAEWILSRVRSPFDVSEGILRSFDRQ